MKDVTLEVGRGELFGLLGPNGAGKTTIIKILSTLLLPTSGTARVLGFDVTEHLADVRRRIGYVTGGDKGLYDRLSALDNLRYFAELYAVEPRRQRARIQELLELVGLAGRERERVGAYSRGMRQRLHIARGLLHQPEMLFLDEPSLGLDPISARELRRTIADLSSQGTTIVLTTHYMAEAEELSDRIAMIVRGRIRALDRPEKLKASVSADSLIEIEARGMMQTHLDALNEVPDVRAVQPEMHGDTIFSVSVRARSGIDINNVILNGLKGTQIVRLAMREPTLEDAYVAIIGGADQETVDAP
ncbi:ABC transporter ATP-binding protein [Nonomuraea sp. NPDC049129]|uniref:ABC transporter ATP-binding protein n=1 Tax=Nonomuraea sp. NPDC049129 TaxID=3155272 RepID=UPI0033F3F25E